MSCLMCVLALEPRGSGHAGCTRWASLGFPSLRHWTPSPLLRSALLIWALTSACRVPSSLGTGPCGSHEGPQTLWEPRWRPRSSLWVTGCGHGSYWASVVRPGAAPCPSPSCLESARACRRASQRHRSAVAGLQLLPGATVAASCQQQWRGDRSPWLDPVAAALRDSDRRVRTSGHRGCAGRAGQA